MGHSFKLNYRGYISLLVVFLSFCDSKRERNFSESTAVILKEDFSLVESYVGKSQIHLLDSVYNPKSLLVVDNLLIVSDKSGEYLTHIFDIERREVDQEKYLGRFLKKGSGPEEAILPYRLFTPKGQNDFAVFDPDLRKVLIVDVDSLLLDGSGVLDKGLNFQGSGVFISDSTILHLDAFDTTARLFIKDHSSNTIAKFGSLPRIIKGNDYINSLELEYYKNLARLEVNEDVVLITYVNIPFMEIFNLKENTRISLDIFSAVPAKENFNRNMYIGASQITDKYIYVLYMNEDQSAFPTSRDIYVFDHLGNPVKKIRLDIAVFEFQIIDGTYIYGLTLNHKGNDYDLLKFQIST